MRRTMLLFAVATIALSTAGCCKKKTPPGYSPPSPTSTAAKSQGPDKAPEPKWGPREVYFGDGSSGHGDIVGGATYELTVRKFPEGTKLSVDGKDTVVPAGGGVKVEIDVGSEIGALTPKAALDYQTKVTPKSKVHVTYPNGVQFDLELGPQDVAYQLKKALDGLKDSRALQFAKDEKAPAQHSILYMSVLQPEVIGPATTMKDVDRIALSENQSPRGGKLCKGYKTTSGKGGTLDLPIQMIDQEVTIYERATAKILAKKSFPAPERCPMFVMNNAASTYPDGETIKKWLREQRMAR